MITLKHGSRRCAPASTIRLTAIGLNDNGATFDEIADVIASEPEGLFVDA